jgi:hypothetical protein
MRSFTTWRNRLLTMAAILCALVTVAASELPASVIDPYLRVHGLLASDTMEGVADTAKAIEAAATALGANGAALTASAKKLAETTTLGQARAAFGDLSAALLDFAAKTKADLPGDLRVAFCPMNNKSWFQKEQEIRNPYYGSQMLTCGAFKK